MVYGLGFQRFEYFFKDLVEYSLGFRVWGVVWRVQYLLPYERESEHPSSRAFLPDILYSERLLIPETTRLGCLEL